MCYTEPVSARHKLLIVLINACCQEVPCPLMKPVCNGKLVTEDPDMVLRRNVSHKNDETRRQNLFICSLCNDGVSRSDCVASNNRMINE